MSAPTPNLHPPPAATPSTHQTDSLTNLHTACKLHWDTDLTNVLQYTSLECIRQDTRFDTAITRFRIGQWRLNSHLHKLGMTENPHCPWCPTKPDTPEHFLLHCPCHHSHRMALLHSRSSLHLRRPTITDLLGGSQDPCLTFKVLKHTRTFLQRTGQLNRV